VVLSGTSAGTLTDGLRADADSITIQGLTISDFDGYGIALLDGSYYTITGNIIGYNADQTELRLNNRGGIFISDDAHYATIGGSDVDDQNTIAGGISFGETIPEGVKILRNKIEVPADWLSGDELRVLIGKGANGSPACVPWNESSSNKLPSPIIFDLTDEYVAGMTRPGATAIVYHVLETGSDRGRYFPRIVEPVAMGTANQNGQYHISVNLEPEMMISVGAVGADGGSSELSQLKRPVIYSPGIGGSWLRGNNDERLWPPLALSGSEKNNRLIRLALDESGNDIEQIRVDGILELAGLAGYGPALSYLQNNGYPGHPENENAADLDLWRFANDWRKNPYELADSLKSLIDFVLSGESSVAKSCEVDIVSHSNGGVIASAYVRKHPEHSSASVNRLLTIGTPYLGTPKAAAAHTRGYVFDIEEILHFTVEWGRMVGMTRNITGAYGLMPSKKYWEATDFGEHPGYLMDLDRNLLSTYDDTFNFITAPKSDGFNLPLGLQRNASLWNNTETNVHGLIDDWREWQGPPNVYRLVGDLPASTTIGWIWEQFPYPLLYLGHLNIHADEGDLIQHVEYRAMQTAVPGDGDGTVSLTSATLGHHPGVGAVDFSGVGTSLWINPFEYYPCDHLGLIKPGCTSAEMDMPIFDRVLGILRSGYIVEPQAIDNNVNVQMNLQSIASNAQENNNVQEVFYITAAAPIGVHIYDSEGNHTGPATLSSTAMSDSIVYGIDGIGYWPNALAATVSLDRNQSYDIRIVTPVGAGQVRVLRVLMDTDGSNLQIVFPDIELQEGGSLQMQLVEGGLPEDAPLMADIKGTGTFNYLLEPALTLSSNSPVPSVPSTDRFIYSIKVNPEQEEDQPVEIGFRGVNDAGWEWELSGNSAWVQPGITSGTLDGPPSLTVLSTTLPEGIFYDTLKIIVRKDDFERENNIVIRLVKDASVSVDENDAQLPFAFRLYQNYPNPFNPSTIIQYNIPSASYVLLEVFNVLGQRVVVLADRYHDAGSYNVQFNAGHLPSGVYMYRIQAEDFSATKKLMLVR
jgi:pimeloyl-ACP methyl ester carboxylesterase